MSDKTITLSLMDPPYDSETTTTALRIAFEQLATISARVTITGGIGLMR